MSKLKPNMPRPYHSLRPWEKDAIENAIQEAMDKEICDTQIIWIKMGCIAVYNIRKSLDDVYCFIATWKRLYQYNSRLPDKAAQDAWLARENERIFGEHGFPEDFVQKFREIGR